MSQRKNSLDVPQRKCSDPSASLQLIPGQQIGHRDTQQAYGPVLASKLSQQGAKHRQHRLCILEPFSTADTARDELEIAPSDLERQRPPCQVQFNQAALHLPGEVSQDALHTVAVHQVALEG